MAAVNNTSLRTIERSAKRLGILVLLSSFAFEGVAQGTTYYASKAGNDSVSCAAAQSASRPKRTITGGISCLAAGDTLLVRAGSYDEQITSVPSGTSWSSV